MTRFWMLWSLAVGLLPPSRTKNWLLTRRPGWTIAPSARVGYNFFVRVDNVSLAAGAHLGTANLIWNMRSLELGERAVLSRLNWVSSSPMFHAADPDAVTDAGTLRIDADAVVQARNHLDCSGGISIGRFVLIGGHSVEILTHSITIEDAAQVMRGVQIGDYSFVGTRCLVLAGADICDHVVVGAGSTVTKPVDKPYSLYAGAPAVWKRELPEDAKLFNRAPGVMQVRT